MKKIIFIIYAAVIAATAITALVFNEKLNIIIDSIVPAGVCLLYFCLGCLLLSGRAYFWGGRLRITCTYRFAGGDFKYSKDKRGKGRFDSVNADSESAARRSITNIISGYLFIISAAATIPLIFFFSLYVKWWASLAIFFVTFISSTAVSAVVDILGWKRTRNAQQAKEAAWQKELDEQKKREEMGRWK